MEGQTNVMAALRYCRECVELYDSFISERKNQPPVQIAGELIKTHGCGMPEHLFMALYTVTQHLSYQKNEER